MSVIGILLAAGYGKRFGSCKQLTAWPPPAGDSTLVATAYDSLAVACSNVIVVLGNEREAVETALSGRDYMPVEVDPNNEMCYSIQQGVQMALGCSRTSFILLQPADHPYVNILTLRALISADKEWPESVVIPRYNRKNGHPIAIPSSLAKIIVEADLKGGLNQWLSRFGKKEYLECNDPTILYDVDSIHDLEYVPSS